MNVTGIQPGQAPENIKIENSLKALQHYVGGRIETVTLANDACVICNEEGRLMGMPYNCTLRGIDFVGPLLLVGIDGEEFCALPTRSAARLLMTLSRR